MWVCAQIPLKGITRFPFEQRYPAQSLFWRYLPVPVAERKRQTSALVGLVMAPLLPSG